MNSEMVKELNESENSLKIFCKPTLELQSSQKSEQNEK